MLYIHWLPVRTIAPQPRRLHIHGLANPAPSPVFIQFVPAQSASSCSPAAERLRPDSSLFLRRRP